MSYLIKLIAMIFFGVFLAFLGLPVGVSFAIIIAAIIGWIILESYIETKAEEEANTKLCVSCAENIQLAAKKCRFCNELQPEIE